MDDREYEYSAQWDISSEYFFNKGYYSWMKDQIGDCSTLVEIGCGTGYGTLALAQAGIKVISIEKNEECIKKAKELLKVNGVSDDQVVIIHGDIVDDIFRAEITNKYDFEAVICWNIGTVWSKQMMEYYLPYMYEYGLQTYQIQQAPESSYAELILWETLRLAKEKGAAVHIVERMGIPIDYNTKLYYEQLAREFGYKNIEYKEIQAESISKGGRVLSSKGVPSMDEIIRIYFVSVLIR